MNAQKPRRPRSWPKKFADAFRGVAVGVRGQNSFRVHFFFTAAVIGCAAGMGMSRLEWCVLLLCIAVVLATELFNSALELLARAITDEHDPRLADALDIGSGSVLVVSIGAALVGSILFLHRLGELIGWWG